MTGSASVYSWNGRKPYHAINFVTVHDGFTMYDLFTYEEKRNGCGLLNPVCCYDPCSAWCDAGSGEDHNRSRNWGDEPTKRQMMRNMFTGMMISHGVPLILGGDEWMRTQLGNNKAYSTSSDNPFNWFDWGGWAADPDRVRMHDFVRQMIRLRKAHPHHFMPEQYAQTTFAWKDANNNDVTDWGVRHIMQHYYDDSQGPQLVVLINMEGGDVTFQLPEGQVWRRVVDTQAYFESADYLSGRDVTLSPNIELEVPEPVDNAYTVKSRSIVILTGL